MELQETLFVRFASRPRTLKTGVSRKIESKTGKSAMKEKRYGYGPWEYRYICKKCGHAVRAPKHEAPCSVCGGEFGPKISVRKLYLEAEKPYEIIEVEYVLDKTIFERIKEAFGFKVAPRYGVREEKRRPSRRWRWQTHAEVEEESGIVRHEDFL